MEATKNYHLFVLVHGLWGNKRHFDYIHQQLEAARGQLEEGEQLVVYRTAGNEGYKTLDGIDVCGLRVAQEIKEQINLLNNMGDDSEIKRVTKISVVGYSLGGLISRYAIGILYHQGYFDTIEPVNFTTFCSPHVGVLMPGNNISVKFFNWAVPNLLSHSGKQMFLKDSTAFKQEPLLSLMANPSSVFYKALQSFKYRNLYANAINDKRTSWFTAGISLVDPFMKIDERSSLNDMDFKFIDNYAPIVIDPHAKFTITTKPIAKLDPVQIASNSTAAPQSNFWERKYRWVVVAANLLVVAPLWVVWFIISGVMETVKSQRRVRSTLKDYHNFFTSMADLIEDDILEDIDDDAISTTGSIKAMEQLVDHAIDSSLTEKTDTLVESVFDAITSKNAAESAKLEQYDIAPDTADTSDEETKLLFPQMTTNNDLDGAPSLKTTIAEIAYIPPQSELAKNEVLKVFALDIAPKQKEIIKNLNDLHWEKYPVLIRHTQSTHSAAIVRNIDEKQLYEGKIVIKHWIDDVLRLV